jgi:hypothetical protein
MNKYYPMIPNNNNQMHMIQMQNQLNTGIYQKFNNNNINNNMQYFYNNTSNINNNNYNINNICNENTLTNISQNLIVENNDRISKMNNKNNQKKINLDLNKIYKDKDFYNSHEEEDAEEEEIEDLE